MIGDALASLAMVAVAAGQVRDAARLLGAEDALRLRCGLLLELEPTAEVEQTTAAVRQTLGDEAFAAAWAAGQEMSLEQATQEAYIVARTAGAGSLSLPASTAGHGLTPRELDVLCLLVEGFSDKEIAEALGISHRTVSKHVEIIRSKLGVPSRTAAATYATRHGLI